MLGGGGGGGGLGEADSSFVNVSDWRPPQVLAGISAFGGNHSRWHSIHGGGKNKAATRTRDKKTAKASQIKLSSRRPASSHVDFVSSL